LKEAAEENKSKNRENYAMKSFRVDSLPLINYCGFIMKISWAGKIRRVKETTLTPIYAILDDFK
jgi:hypothetical protein